MRPIYIGAFISYIFMGSASFAETPMLMEGKSSLFQRVLIREQTTRHDSPDGAAGDALAPLQPLFVYERQDGWLRVGKDDEGADTFWVVADKTTEWRQNIVATMEGSENLGRVLFFANEDAVFNAVESEDLSITVAAMRDAAIAAEQGGPPSEDIVALGPRATPDLRESLYVMPILSSEEAILETNGAYVNVLKVAVARAGNTNRVATDTASGEITDRGSELPVVAREDFRAGVVFVVDTTISMEAYIRGTRDALQTVYQNFAAGGLEDAVSFGLVGYRDSLDAAPDLGYDVRTFVTLDEGADPAAFLAGISQMTEAESTSRNFREDSFAAIDYALEEMNWAGFDARYIVLVTDASPRLADDEFSKTGLTGSALNSLVRERLGAAIAVLHLRTDRGSNDHARAEAAYRDLAGQSNQASLYFPVADGDPAAYISAAEKLGTTIATQVATFRGGDDSALEAGQIPEADTPADPITAAIASAGRTMQLAYLGRESGTAAPDVFEAYVTDRDFDRPGLNPLSIRLLLTKSQLSDLDESLRLIMRMGEENILSADQMFNQVLSAAADMSRRPDTVSRNADTTLAEVALIAELLEGLPYQSRIMTVTEDDWLRMSISEQQTILSGLADKIELYARFNESTDQWVDYLGTGADADNLLYPMKLNDLP